MKYSLGGFYSHRDFMRELLLEKKTNPQIFNNDFQIDSLYDSFPNVIFNGGRLFIMKDFVQGKGDELEALVKFYNNQGIGIRYTYSNSAVEARHLADPYANLTLEIAHNEMNGVIVNNPILEDYIRHKYPKYKIIISTTAQQFDPEWYKRRREEVDIFVLPVELNFDEKLIEIIGADKVEIMVNEGCAANCPFKKDHYAASSRDQLALRDENLEGDVFFRQYCPIREGTSLWKTGYRFDHPPVRLGLDQMRMVERQFGVTHFKIICRSMPLEMFYDQIERYLLRRSARDGTRLKAFVAERKRSSEREKGKGRGEAPTTPKS